MGDTRKSLLAKLNVVYKEQVMQAIDAIIQTDNRHARVEQWPSDSVLPIGAMPSRVDVIEWGQLIVHSACASAAAAACFDGRPVDL